MGGGRIGVSPQWPLRTPTQSPTKNITKTEKPQKNYKTSKPHKNSKTPNQKRKKNSKPVQSVAIFSANCAGCANKVQSLVNSVNHLNAGIITLQETHFKRKGKINNKFNDFQIFEAIRKKHNGGTLIGVHKSLDPILIEEYSDEFELLVVEVKLGEKDVRIISGYGPQENVKLEEKMPFFRSLEEEIIKATYHGKSVYIQMDANSKLGPDVIAGDPHKQSENGKILHDIIKRNVLTVMNGLRNKCTGRITRRRITSKVKEESIIDFVIVSEDIEDIISEVVIDEDKNHVLTRYTKTKNGTKTKESDHNSIITHIKVKWDQNKNIQKIEVYNLKDPDGMKKFKEMTSKIGFLSEVFQDENKNVNTTSKRFIKRLGFCISKCFKKVRINGTYKNKALEELLNRRRILRSKKDEKSLEEL